MKAKELGAGIKGAPLGVSVSDNVKSQSIDSDSHSLTCMWGLLPAPPLTLTVHISLYLSLAWAPGLAAKRFLSPRPTFGPGPRLVAGEMRDGQRRPQAVPGPTWQSLQNPLVGPIPLHNLLALLCC